MSVYDVYVVWDVIAEEPVDVFRDYDVAETWASEYSYINQDVPVKVVKVAVDVSLGIDMRSSM